MPQARAIQIEGVSGGTGSGFANLAVNVNFWNGQAVANGNDNLASYSGGAGPIRVIGSQWAFDPISSLWRRAQSDETGILKTTERSHTLFVNTAGGANLAATLTLPAAGAGLFHYIVSIRLSRIATAALAGAALLAITTTNLGAMAWRVGNAMVAGGTQLDVDFQPAQPYRSAVANTASTIVCPIPGAAVSWELAATYYTSNQSI